MRLPARGWLSNRQNDRRSNPRCDSQSETLHWADARQHAPFVLLERLAAPSLSRRRRRMQFLPPHERRMKEQIDGNHQRQIDDRNHVDIGPGKAIARYLEY